MFDDSLFILGIIFLLLAKLSLVWIVLNSLLVLHSQTAVDKGTNVVLVVAGGAVKETLDLLSLGYGYMTANSLTLHSTDSGMLFGACFLPCSTCASTCKNE